MRRWVSPLALVVCLVSGCASAVAGEATPEKVIGVTQTSTLRGGIEFTPLALVDPAPVYKESEYAPDPEPGTRLAAVQLKVTNMASEDRLVGPVGLVRFHGSDGKTYDDSLTATSAGAMLDQLRLAPKQTMIGYLTVELPGKVTVDSVDVEIDPAGHGELTWHTAGQAVKEPPELPARSGDGPAALRSGEKATVEGESDGDDYRLTITPTKMTDPAETTDDRIQVGPDRRLLGIDFTVHNDGDKPYSDVESDADLRIFAVQNKEDEAITSHVYGATEDHGMPLAPGEDDVWHVLFVVPTHFEVDRVSFSPSFGSDVATVWTM